LDTERIFDLLQKQNDTLIGHGILLARIEAMQGSTKERLDHVIPVVAEHGKQLGYAKGAAAILAMLWTGAIAVVAALLKGHH
jgi:hypothetical protein